MAHQLRVSGMIIETVSNWINANYGEQKTMFMMIPIATFLFLSIFSRITRPRDYSLTSRQTKLEGPGVGAFVIGFLVIFCVIVCLKRYADVDVVETTQNFVMRLI